jgi:hypothetical protein
MSRSVLRIDFHLHGSRETLSEGKTINQEASPIFCGIIDCPQSEHLRRDEVAIAKGAVETLKSS